MFLSVVLVPFPVLLWMAPCLPGHATAHSFTISKDNDQHTARTRCHQHSEMRPISGRICCSIIMCKNPAHGTNCYTTLRPAMKVADKAYSAKKRKKSWRGNGEKGEPIRILFNQRQLSQRGIKQRCSIEGVWQQVGSLVTEITWNQRIKSFNLRRTKQANTDWVSARKRFQPNDCSNAHSVSMRIYWWLCCAVCFLASSFWLSLCGITGSRDSSDQ